MVSAKCCDPIQKAIPCGITMVDREACDAAEKKKCLIVQGARQVGKTFVMEQFAAEEYEELPEINFKKTPSAMEIFSGDLSVEAMHTAMQFRYPRLKIEPGKTLIFL